MNELLEARETRSKHIQTLIQKHPHKSVVVLKANVPGTNKNLMKMRFICNYFNQLLFDEFESKVIDVSRIESVDGNYIYYVIDEEGTLVKEKTILLEDDNQLGRLVDIDVYQHKPISRTDVACEMRKCLVCDNYAHICVRSKAHTESELFTVIDEMVETFLLDYILNNTVKAIFAEVDMYPKFGLVSRHDSGAHKDMDYQTFVQSTLALKPYLKQFIEYGLTYQNDPKVLQQIGKEAEKAMFEATNGINTHKGLIFALGLFLPVVTKGILENKDRTFIQEEIKRISEIVIGDYYETIKEPYSHGDQMYIKYGLKGIRGEALNGFDIIFNSPSYKYVDSIHRELDYLIYFMSKLNDTTILYRNDLNILKQVHKDMNDIINSGGYTNNEQKVLELSNSYKANNISPGGSADLLVLKLLFEEFRYLLCGDTKQGICL